jgi:branched-chain amino acid transport system permease protein
MMTKALSTKALAVVATLVFLYFLPYGLDSYQIHVADVTILYAMLAIGLGIAMGIAGQINLAQVAMFGIGAYVVAIETTQHGMGFWTSAVLGVIASVLAGLVIGIPALRVQSHYLGIVTLGLALAFTSWVTNATITQGAEGISGIPAPPFFGVDLNDEYLYYYLEAVVFVLSLAWGLFVVRTRIGRRMRGMRDDSIAVSTLGVNVPVLRLIAFGIASIYGGVAGVLYAGLIKYVSPESFSIASMFLLLAMVIIGGRQSIIGCVIGAVVLSIVREWLTDFSTWAQFGYGAIVVVCVVFAPTGLAGLPRRVSALRRRKNVERVSLKPLDLRRLRSDEPEEDSRQAASLSIDEVDKSFRGLRALDGVSLSVDAGQIKGIVGPNGSGKTTLLNIISGLYDADNGRFRLADEDVTNLGPAALSAKGVARTFQNLRLFRDLTVRENLLLALDRSSSASTAAYFSWLPGVLTDETRLRAKADQLMTEFGIADYADEIPSSLPYGVQRRVELTRAMATNPRILLLDEPAAGLNGQEAAELADIVRAVRDSGVTVVLVEHNMALVMSLCDRVAVLANGKVIADGEPGVVVADPQVIEAYLGDAAQFGDLIPTEADVAAAEADTGPDRQEINT